jgi:hypothetical protein
MSTAKEGELKIYLLDAAQIGAIAHLYRGEGEPHVTSFAK